MDTNDSDYLNSYVVNYNGDVYKCTARPFTHTSRVGFLSRNGEIVIENKSYNEVGYKFKPVCKKCRILPICRICSQAHIESDGCPRHVTEDEKDRQILNRLEELYPELFKNKDSR